MPVQKLTLPTDPSQIRQSITPVDYKVLTPTKLAEELGGGRVVRRCWVNFQCRGVLLIWIIVRQGPIALVVGAGGGCLDIFLSSITPLFFLPLSRRRPDID